MKDKDIEKRILSSKEGGSFKEKEPLHGEEKMPPQAIIHLLEKLSGVNGKNPETIAQQHRIDIKKKRFLTIQWSLGVGAVLLVGITSVDFFHDDRDNILLVFGVVLTNIVTTLIGAVIGSSVE